MIEFSTNDIVKILKIPRQRLRGWHDDTPGGFIKPSVREAIGPGSGKGALYSTSDLYSIALFKHLIETVNINRETAARIVKECHNSVQAKGGFKDVDCMVVVNATSSEDVSVMGAFFASTEDDIIPLKIPSPRLVDIENKIDVVKDAPVKFWDNMLILNIYKIRTKVDQAISNYTSKVV